MSAALFVMILMMPSTALEPHTLVPGPRTTSIRSTSSNSTSCTSQKTPLSCESYTIRSSICTSSLLLNRPANPRMEMDHLFESICATSTPAHAQHLRNGLRRSLRRIISLVMTNTAAGDCPTVLSCRDTVETGMSRDSEPVRPFT